MITTELSKKPALTSTLFLVLANIVPLLGAIFFDWHTGEILVLYWAENLVIGLYHIIKMLTAPLGPNPNQNMSDQVVKLITTGFFALHYGFFCVGHGVFVFVLTAFTDEKVSFLTIVLGLFTLFISHGISLLNNYFGKKEYLKTTTGALLFAPYQRIVTMHIVILIGGAITLFLNLPLAALIVLIVLKTSIDLKAHYKEHEKGAGLTVPKEGWKIEANSNK